MRRHACVGLVGIASAVVFACGDDLGPRIPAAIVVTPEAPQVPVAGTLQLAITVVDESGAEIPGHPLTFQSSDTTALTVDDAGLLTSVDWIDSSLITVTSGDLTAQVEAEVVLPPSALVPRMRSLELDTGEERLLTFAVTDENGDSVWGARATFESSNPRVAPVRRLSDTEAPLVTGLLTGSATVTLRSGGLTAEVPVTVAQIPASVTITPSDLVLSPGGSEQAAVMINDRTGDEIVPPAPFRWSSSDEAVVTVSPTGLVTSVGLEGSAVITATADTFTATLPVFVGTPPTVEMLGRVELFFAEGVAVLPDGRYFVGGAETFGRGVLPDFTLPARIPIGGELKDVVVSADGTRAYLIGPSRVAVVDLTTNTQVDSIEVSLGGGVAGALSSDGSVLTVGTTHGFERFEVATNRSLGGTAVGFVLKITHHPTRPLLYASSGDMGVLELDDRSGEIVRRIGGTADSHVLSPDGERLYVVSGGEGGVDIWNLETEAQEPSAGPVVGNDLTVSPDGRFLYVMRSANIDGRLYVVDAKSGATLREVVLGGLPKRIAMSADGVAIITNEGDEDVFGWVDFVR